ncbi:hypothetical protein GCM10009570_05300 [Dietzia natronolimnaea]
MHPSPPTAARATRRGLALLSAVLLSATALTQLSPARAAAAPVTIDGLTYVATPGNPTAGATVTSCGTAGPTISVPDTVTIEGTDYAVTDIGDYACDRRQLTSVTLPNALASIGYAAFYGNQLGSLTLPDTLTTVGGHAFAQNHLTSLTMSHSLTTIGYHAFAENRLTSVALPESLTTVGAGAFHINRLESITLHDGLTAIGANAFSANRLTSVALPESLGTIGNWAFEANRLTSVLLPDSLTSIGEGAFGFNPELTQVRFTGPAPATITGADQQYPSLGTAAGLTVAFHARHQGQTPQQGFTTPEWHVYTAMPAYTLTFDTGVSGSIVEPEIVWPGAPLTMPADPVRPSHVFTGWFTQLYPKRPFDPQAPLTSDLTLRAGWKYSQDSTRPPLVSSTSLNLGSLGALEAVPGD